MKKEIINEMEYQKELKKKTNIFLLYLYLGRISYAFMMFLSLYENKSIIMSAIMAVFFLYIIHPSMEEYARELAELFLLEEYEIDTKCIPFNN